MTTRLDPIAEAEHNAALRELAYNAFLELRDTLKSNYNARSLGYESAEHARLVITIMTSRRMDKMSAEHLRKNK